MKNKFLIWWTNQSDCERVEMLTLDWPKYLADEFQSRYGRSGRGRLWTPKELDDDKGMPNAATWSDTDMNCRMAADAGGIVILSSDYIQVGGLPGFVTKFDMTLVRPAHDADSPC